VTLSGCIKTPSPLQLQAGPERQPKGHIMRRLYKRAQLRSPTRNNGQGLPYARQVEGYAKMPDQSKHWVMLNMGGESTEYWLCNYRGVLLDFGTLRQNI
jgi:hypothetical protein